VGRVHLHDPVCEDVVLGVQVTGLVRDRIRGREYAADPDLRREVEQPGVAPEDVGLALEVE
jgi:hypothetical protein